ncbi:MAG: aspartate aminotransferase family protein [Methyloligellaceae bacterium]
MSSLLPTYSRFDLTFESGQGSYLTAKSGERYLDFGAGIAVTSLGHAHPHLVEALASQAGKLWHTSNLYKIEGQEKLAERLTAATFADLAFFTNSGAEAMECAIKMARKYHFANGNPERFRLITFEGAFHGRTLATIAAGGQEKYLEGFGPAVEGFDQVPLGDIQAVKDAIGPETAGILLEPLQGEGGIRTVDPGFVKQLRALCDEHGLLLVLDEIQSGMGRTGHLFAYEMSGVEPDIMAVAKGLGGGFPVGACLATGEAAKGMQAGSHGSTFGGNPLAMAVGNAVLDVMLEDDFLAKVREKGIIFKQKLAQLVDENSDIFELVRGEGLMMGLKCKVPVISVVSELIEQKMLAVGAGENVLRLLPPLVIGEEEMNEACESLSKACAVLRDPAKSVR